MQQINLYATEFQPRRQYAFLSLRNSVALCGAVFVLGCAIALGQAWYAYRLRAQLAALQTQIQAEQTALAADQSRLAEHLPSPGLVAELEKLNNEESAKKELLTALESSAPADQQGYSGILTSLASHPVEGLWVTNIDIAGGDVGLSGLTRSAELVPDFIDTLVKDANFGPRRYRALTMKMTDGGLLAFQMRGRPDEEKAP